MLSLSKHEWDQLVQRLLNYPGQEKRFVLYSGYFYGLVALLGFVWPGDMLLGNGPERWLHVGLAMVIVAAGVLSTPAQARLKAEYS